MIKINLLPIKEIRQKLRRRYEFFGLFGALAVVLLVLGGITLVMALQAGRLEARISDLEAERASYVAIQREIDGLRRKREELEVKIAAIDQLRADSQLPVRIVDEISNLTPSARMWLTSLRMSGTTINLAGIGLDNPTIAQYMQALERSPYFSSADLTSSTQTEVGGNRLKSFSLVIRVTPPKPASEEAE
ncbi:PilN domain-containing protein [Desulfurivibrio alkaliphilus]|uniref:Fimbrial assembly family protein n=1 Tax=Desulfurivibrio alkaliphilus (strain DSM 19089 / UNIQEM U267 / AHT2) TaxID=589865 RepID=D6Z6Z0_DESAT|nr:PilN domain-containing protein [Desulfurivibrio alkaliphilus]ADH86977.1 Fimbrial assembly family protein [Desulfurivibrio alkaliphilus AHT 2]